MYEKRAALVSKTQPHILSKVLPLGLLLSGSSSLCSTSGTSQLNSADNSVLCVHYFSQAISGFPHHLLSGFVCLASIFLMSFLIQQEKKNRLIAVLTPTVLTVIIVVLCILNGRTVF